MLGGNIRIGARVFVNRYCYFDLTERITIEDDVDIGHHVKFITAGHEIGPTGRRCGKVVASPIRVGKGAWIGANVTILPGVEIGEGAVIGVNSLVMKHVPPNSLAVGVPARIVRTLAS